MPIELKPCPACSDPSPEISNTGRDYYVSCPHCCMRGPEAGGPTWATEAWNDMPRRLRWTKEPPKEPGWYWHEENHGGKHPAHVFRVVTSALETGIYVRFFGQPADVIHKIDHISGKWAGPMPEPEE